MSDCRIIVRQIGSWGDNSLETRETDFDFKYEPNAPVALEEAPAKVME